MLNYRLLAVAGTLALTIRSPRLTAADVVQTTYYVYAHVSCSSHSASAPGEHYSNIVRVEGMTYQDAKSSVGDQAVAAANAQGLCRVPARRPYTVFALRTYGEASQSRREDLESFGRLADTFTFEYRP